jgi:hypothetical protein
MSTSPGTGVPRDNRLRGEADTYYGLLPASALEASVYDLRAVSVPSKRILKSKLSKWTAAKQKALAPSYDFLSKIPNQHDDRTFWVTTNGSKRCRIQTKRSKEIELHQSTCLNLDSTSESELWILPDFEEWELDSESAEQLSAPSATDEWGTLIARAVDSNRDRLRRRLEGDGWDFVGGKYGEDGESLEAEDMSEGSVDEEFDVVVLQVS